MDKFIIEAAPGGGFYAYRTTNCLCTAYGDTPEDACENLRQELDQMATDVWMMQDYN